MKHNDTILYKWIDFFSVVSVVSMFFWYYNSFEGGAFIYLFEYGLLLLIMFCIYISTLIFIIYRVLNGKGKMMFLSKVFHVSFAVLLLTTTIYNSELFKSAVIIKAIMVDDLYSYTLVFRTDGGVTTEINGMFGYTETINGKYHLSDSLIIFDIQPYDKGFLKDTMLIDPSSNALYMYKDSNGQFIKKKDWLSNFDIIEMSQY
ncbi:hypothetical protein [Lewinella sp. 4G2]|uniref:hypothetical protein n=1 Tax=Lewinella sp. 4G2 TaxID=1803372 RepID=UPI0007E23342|nr:hypothetical protein [Lewinella sp. 4G2]OAV45131.1 hypothetical protein A3850_011800 [Lewinella sp. 4G2]